RPGELEVVRRMSPDAGARAHLLSDFDSEHPTGEGIPDPFGGSREAYEECLRRVTEHVQRVAAVVIREGKARREAESASRDRGAAGTRRKGSGFGWAGGGGRGGEGAF